MTTPRRVALAVVLALCFAWCIEANPNLRVKKASPQPMPKFNGYIMLAQYVCHELFCPEWSLTVTRLATECFTLFCEYEETQLSILQHRQPRAHMEWPVLTAYHHQSRTMYTTAFTPHVARLWTSSVSGFVNQSSVVNTCVVKLPSAKDPLVSLEATPANVVLAIFASGAVFDVNPSTCKLTRFASLLSDGARTVTQATTIDTTSNTLYATSVGFNASAPAIVTMDLSTGKVVREVSIPVLPYDAFLQVPFQIAFVPQISQLVLFATGLFDNLIFFDPTSGNASYAVFNLMGFGNLAFRDNTVTRNDDTYKNVAYDEVSGNLYFQAHQYDDGGMWTPALVSVGPFNGPTLPTFDWVTINLAPIDFGYQGMHYVHCDPVCPT